MNCPYCGKELKLPERVLRNVDSYGRALVVTTKCCKRPLNVHPVREYTVSKYEGNHTVDDWGVPFKKGDEA